VYIVVVVVVVVLNNVYCVWFVMWSLINFYCGGTNWSKRECGEKKKKKEWFSIECDYPMNEGYLRLERIMKY